MKERKDFWFKHSLMFDEDYRIKYLASGYFAKEDLYIGHYYVRLYEKLLYTFFKEGKLPTVLEGEIDTRGVSIILGIKENVGIDLIDRLVEIELIDRKGNFLNNVERFFGNSMLLKKDSKYLFDPARKWLVTRKNHYIVLPPQNGSKRKQYRRFSDLSEEDTKLAMEYAAKETAKRNYEILKDRDYLDYLDE